MAYGLWANFFLEKNKIVIFFETNHFDDKDKRTLFLFDEIGPIDENLPISPYKLYFLYLFLLFELQLLYECLWWFSKKKKMDIFLISLCLCHGNWPSQRHKLKQHNRKWYITWSWIKFGIVIERVTHFFMTFEWLLLATGYWLLATVELFRLHIFEYNNDSFRSGTAKRTQC